MGSFSIAVCILLLTSFVPYSWASTGVRCGKPRILPSTRRIVNGHESRQGAWPWVVLLLEMNVPVCGGTILNDRVIMTAAHCFDERRSRNVRRWRVVAGKHHAYRYDRTEQSYQVSKLVMHERYDSATVNNDVALLILRQRIRFTDYIMPACLPTPSEILTVGKTCYLAGWGDTLGTGNDKVLNQVALPIISDNQCSQPDWYGSEFLPSTTICAGYEAGTKDACTGDSGSPLVCKHGSKWYAQGIASWGYGCAEAKWPGLYTEVYTFVTWIKLKAASEGYTII